MFYSLSLNYSLSLTCLFLWYEIIRFWRILLHSEQRTRISAASDFCRKEVTCAERTSWCLCTALLRAAVLGVKVTKVLKEPLPWRVWTSTAWRAPAMTNQGAHSFEIPGVYLIYVSLLVIGLMCWTVWILQGCVWLVASFKLAKSGINKSEPPNQHEGTGHRSCFHCGLSSSRIAYNSARFQVLTSKSASIMQGWQNNPLEKNTPGVCVKVRTCRKTVKMFQLQIACMLSDCTVWCVKVQSSPAWSCTNRQRLCFKSRFWIWACPLLWDTNTSQT